MKLKVVLGLVVLALVIWFASYALTPPPGSRMKDLGRDHIAADKVALYTYNSNPPTSGPHLETWVKPGVYDSSQSEGELLHSLEHGYVVVGYNCSMLSQQKSSKIHLVSRVYADHPDDSGLPQPATASGELSGAEATTSAKNSSDACQLLVSELEALVRKKTLFKLVLVPRPKQDVPVTLVAWTYIDTLDTFDATRIERFIDYHRDHGPEQTME